MKYIDSEKLIYKINARYVKKQLKSNAKDNV